MSVRPLHRTALRRIINLLLKSVTGPRNADLKRVCAWWHFPLVHLSILPPLAPYRS